MNSLRKRLMGVPITFFCFKCGARLVSYRFCGRGDVCGISRHDPGHGNHGLENAGALDRGGGGV